MRSVYCKSIYFIIFHQQPARRYRRGGKFPFKKIIKTTAETKGIKVFRHDPPENCPSLQKENFKLLKHVKMKLEEKIKTEKKIKLLHRELDS